MKLTGTDLPPALVTAVRSGFDAFVQLQRVRFGNSTGESVQPAVEGAVARWGATAVVGVANAPANHTNNMNNNSNINNTKNNTNNNAFTMFPSTLCEWSDLVLSRLKAMKESVVLDPTAEVVWELVSTVIAILETGGAEGVNASAPYLEWYRSRFVNVDSIYQVRDTLSAVYSKDSLTQAEETDLFEGVVGPYMISIQRAFLAGLFPVAAELISSLVDYLRSCAVVPFDAEEEGILTDVIRLLLEPPTNSVEHREWMSTANGLIIDAKRILTESRDDSNMIMQVARQLKSLCLDLLLMMSGDAALILDVCHLLELDVMDYIAAICAVCEPYMNLHQLHHLYKSALDSWKGTVCGPWYVGVIESLLGSRSVVDIVTAMHLVGQAVRCNAYMSGWKNHDDNDDNNNNNVVSSPTNPHIVGDLNDTYNTYDDNTSNDTNEGNLNDSSNSSYNSRSGSSSSSNSSSSSSDNNNNNMNGKSTSVCSSTEETEGHSTLYRRFALLFMAAHVADICAPPLGAAVTHMSITFHRNELVEDFVALFSRHPLLWRTAAMYVMYSPFMNPAILSHIVRRRAATAVKDRYTCLALHTFIHSTWDENSPFQLALRQILRDKYPLSQTVDKWITAVDFYRRKTVEALNADIIKERLLCANTAPAMWLALECQQSKSLQLHFEKILRSPLALQSEEVYRVGQAVNNSFISVDASANLRMLHVLRLCAALCEYRRSLELLQQYDENNKNKNNNNNNNNNVEVSDIQLLQVTLRAAEKALLYVVDFRMHPVAVLTLVEQTAAVAHRLSHSQRPYTLLPLLIHALELAMTSNPTEQSEQRVRAAGIREKIMKLL